jgi:hypothetical protein
MCSYRELHDCGALPITWQKWIHGNFDLMKLVSLKTHHVSM